MELFHLSPPPLPSGDLILSLELLVLQEGWWPLITAFSFHVTLECAVSLSPAWDLLPVSMSWEAAHVGLEREAHKSQAGCFLLPQFVPGFCVWDPIGHLGWLL